MTQTTTDCLPAEVLNLGEPRTVFPGNKSIALTYWVCGGLVILLGIAIATMLGYGVLFEKALDKPDRKWGVIFAAFVIPVMVILGIYCIYYGRFLYSLRYVIALNGLARVEGKRYVIMPWDGLQLYVLFIPNIPGTQNNYLIQCGTLKWKLIYDIQKVDKLGVAVSEGIVRRQLDSHLQRIFDGETISFGPVSISRDGLVQNGRILAWDSVDTIEDISGHNGIHFSRLFVIKQQENNHSWAELDANQVLNFELMFEIIRNLQPDLLDNSIKPKAPKRKA